MGETGYITLSLGILCTSYSQLSNWETPPSFSCFDTVTEESCESKRRLSLCRETNVYCSLRMRRTRHVVLPVRSWEHVGLMMVSLACLTLGVVSRDREGQAGSLAGPDLQHCAPHKVDACPNDNVFTRLPFYDDSATPSGPPNDEPKEHRTTRVLETRESRLTRVRVSRFEPGRAVERRDSRRDDRGTDSRSLERDSVTERRNLHISERRNDQRRSQQIRLSRSLERDSVNRYSRSLADRTTERRDGRLSDRRTDRLRNSERDSSTARKFLATAERRDTRLEERRNERRSTQTQISRSLRRESDSTNSRSLTGRSNGRDTSVRAFQRAVEHRDDQRRRQTREIRMIQSDFSARNSRLASESRDRSTRSLDRATAGTRNAEFLNERRDSRLTSDRVTSLRSIDRDSAARNSRLVTERRDARLSERRDERRTQRARLNRSALIRNSRLAATEGESERREARVSARREDREIRDARSHRRIDAERDSYARSISLEAERMNRRVRGARSLDRDSRTRNLDRESRIRDIEMTNERRIRDRRSTQRSLHSATERRENRGNDGIRVARSSERDLETREARSVSESRGDRRVLSLRSTGRDSTVRNVRERFVKRNTERDERYNSERFDSRRSSVTGRRIAENRVDRSTDLHQIRENLMHDGRIERRDVRVMGEKSLRLDRDSRVITRAMNNRDRAYRRSRETRAPAAIRDDKTREKPVTRGAGLMFEKINREQFLPSATKYEGLRETAILILCAVYGASLFGTGKGSITGNIMDHVNRIVVW